MDVRSVRPLVLFTAVVLAFCSLPARAAEPEQEEISVAIEVRLLSIPETFFFERVGVDFSGKPHSAIGDHASFAKAEFLNEQQVVKFIEAVQADRDAHIMQAPRMTMLNRQVAKLDLTDTQNLLIEDPEVGLHAIIPIRTGFSMSVQPTVSADRRLVKVALELKRSSLAASDMPSYASNLTQLNKSVVVPNGSTMMVAVPNGEAADRQCEFGPPVLSKIPYVNRLFKNSTNAPPAKRLYVLITPRIIAPDEGGAIIQTGFVADALSQGVVNAAVKPLDAVPQRNANEPLLNRKARVLAELLRAYDEACAAGQGEEAARFAQAALTIDPTCFRGRR